MANQKAIRQKIKSVRNIQKITRAMKMVAAAKLKRVQEKVGQSRPYAQKMRDLVSAVAPHARDVESPLLMVRDVKTIGVVVLTGDKGLCGGFNNSVIRKAVRGLEEFGKTPYQLMTIGRKGYEYFKRRDYPIVKNIPSPGVNAAFTEIQAIADAIAQWYVSGAVDAVYFVYAVFKSAVSQKPEFTKFLPIEPPSGAAGSDGAGASADYLFEPAAPQLLGNLLPRFLRIQVYQYLLESMASEQGARMTAMTSATENAGELIDSLTLAYNKARQWAITKELLDIVGGAEALKQAN